MLPTRLILIDGMTGSGKSTTAQRLWLHLLSLGYDACWHYEHDIEHPVWRTEETAQALAAGNIGFDDINSVILARWREFAAAQARTNAVTIIESTFFQTAAGFLLSMDFAPERITAHLLAAEAAIAELNPALVYFYQNDVASALQAIFADRQADGFEAALVEYVAQTPYGKAHGVNGFDGLLAFCQTWREQVDSVFVRLRINKLAIENAARDWRGYERQMTDFLGLPPIPANLLALAALEAADKFTGHYQDADSNAVIAIAADGDGLYFDDARRTRLIPGGGNRFHVQAMNLELAFEDEGFGVFQSFRLTGKLPGLNPLWLRLADAAGARP